jgi:hypothetical protein
MLVQNTIDTDFNARWSANGDNHWIRYYLDTKATIETVKIARYRGNERKALFDIQTSLDSTSCTTVYSSK